MGAAKKLELTPDEEFLQSAMTPDELIDSLKIDA